MAIPPFASAPGISIASGDLRYVKKAGDTMTGTLSTTGSLMASGAYTETTTSPGFYAGGPTTLGTPRFMLADGTASRNWQFDNNGGTFRFFTPGNVHMQITAAGLLSSKTHVPFTTATYDIGSPSLYWANLYASRHYLNSTAYIDGTTAGRADITGDVRITNTGLNPSLTSVMDSSAANQPAILAKNNTNFAHGSNIIKAQMVNATDTGDVLKLENAGSGNYITADTAFSVAKSGTVTLADAANVVIGSTTGTKIGTASTQKIGFYGVTPVVKPANIAPATGTVASVQTAVNAVLTLLQSLGLMT